MKKMFSKILAGTLILAMLAGCSGTETPSSSEPETSETETASEPESISETAETSETASEDTLPALTAILDDISANYWPGTAGCSLNAAIKAAALLDWYTKDQPQGDAVAAAAEAWYGKLTEEDQTLFAQQIGDVYSAAKQLGGENAAGLIESAGITSDYYPWQADAAKTLFGAIYTGIGMDLPEDTAESSESALSTP